MVPLSSISREGTDSHLPELIDYLDAAGIVVECTGMMEGNRSSSGHPAVRLTGTPSARAPAEVGKGFRHSAGDVAAPLRLIRT
eukprot:gene4307-biopygen2613